MTGIEPNDQEGMSPFEEEVAGLRRRVEELEQVQAHLRRAERAAEAARLHAQGIIETVREPLLVLDTGLRVQSANRAFYDTFRVTPGETLGEMIYNLGNRQWDIPRLRALLDGILIENLRFEGFEVEHEFQSIGRKVMLLNARRVVGEENGTQTILLAIEDITDRKRTEDEMVSAALIDPLTGLYNRRGLFILAEKLVERSRREGKGFHLLYIDLDDLKTINDRFGHDEGDRVLRTAAGILRDNFRESDIIARIGGDEFVVLPIGATGEAPQAVLSRLQRAVDASNSGCDRAYALSISAGVAAYEPQLNRPLSEILADADAAMYRQKRHRRAPATRAGSSEPPAPPRVE